MEGAVAQVMNYLDRNQEMRKDLDELHEWKDKTECELAKIKRDQEVIKAQILALNRYLAMEQEELKM
jgi:hypothetical protein